MCGINGFVSSENLSLPSVKELLRKMNHVIIHRGPDEDGFFEKMNDKYSVGLAMRRLSIIDLSTGSQPISSEDGKVTIVFNGEIYNYLQLKKELEKKGITFRTNSDTEVILKLYQDTGVSSFGRLDGMFAFSIFDETLNKVFIVRDFFGEKPLYYTKTNGRFVWASELKSILQIQEKRPEISPEGLNLYLQLTYIPAPFTIYKEVKKLEANSYLELDCVALEYSLKGVEQKQKTTVDPEIDFKAAKNLTAELVRESVLSRSISDVPLGTFLSGGVDSSIISLCLAQQRDEKINTFSIGFEKKSFDETDKSRTVANLINSEHHEFIISEGDLKDNLDHILLNFDEPFADSSSLPTYMVAHKTSQKVKVALTGDGGDEVFGGYNKYYMGKLNARYTSFVPQFAHHGLESMISPFLSTKDDNRGFRFRAKRLLKAVNYEGDFYYNIISLGYQEQEVANILRQEYVVPKSLGYYKNKVGKQNKTLTDFRGIDQLLSLEGDMLVKVDRTSMLTSLESRAPFLNKNLWQFTSQLPEQYLIKGWNKKYLLKEAFKEYFPEGFLDKSKQGFGVPVGDWLRGYLKDEIVSYIEPGFLQQQGLFIPENIREIVIRHLEGKVDNTFRVWTFYCFQKWYINQYSRDF